jgi:hypothetical protein
MLSATSPLGPLPVSGTVFDFSIEEY